MTLLLERRVRVLRERGEGKFGTRVESLPPPMSHGNCSVFVKSSTESKLETDLVIMIRKP